MASGWTLQTLVGELAGRRAEAALIAVGADGLVSLSATELADRAARLATGLLRDGLKPGEPVALFAPNGPDWVVARIAIGIAGGVAVALDDLLTDAEVAVVLGDAGCRWVFTVAAHLASLGAARLPQPVRPILLDGDDAASWSPLFADRADPLPPVEPDAAAMIVYTSGTTGAPKSFTLSYANLHANLAALLRADQIAPSDRVLLPLPLHHVYPFLVGLLTPLAVGAAVVFPASVTGAQVVEAMRVAGVTVVVGVPRLYSALLAGIEARVAARGPLALGAFRALLGVSRWTLLRTGRRLGRTLFGSLHRQMAPRLRLLVSGGAHLDEETNLRLEALGWEVLSGYGLAETASLFTGNLPRRKRAGSAGLALSGEMRIAAPDDGRVGEIELRGPAVFAGYRNNPEANRAAFTADGWFRTGDLGYIDRDGFLFITGRAKEMIVLGGGKNIYPDELERCYGASPYIKELAVLERAGALVALVLPSVDEIHAAGVRRVDDIIRVTLGECARTLPPFQRLAGFAVARMPLPRTRLGKYQRFLLPKLYQEALEGAQAPAATLSAADQDLLGNPTAKRLWALMAERYHDKRPSLASHPQLDLGIDSLEAITLAMDIEARLGLRLSEEHIAGVASVRELLANAAAGGPPDEAAHAQDLHWLDDPPSSLRALGAMILASNRMAVRMWLRLGVTGIENVDRGGPYVIAPNHTSDLDPAVVAAAVPARQLRHLYWGGDAMRLFRRSWLRLLCQALRIFPVDQLRPAASLTLAAEVLKRGRTLAWFPEEWRSPTGELQQFRPGIGWLLKESGVPVIPAYIRGAHAAMPRGSRWPRPVRVTIAFGPPVKAADLAHAGAGATENERIADGLRCAVASLKEAPPLASTARAS